ncbi:MAG: hypothetical protein HYX54_05465 [Chloroflexi bacterium]|nr:hypothetical protein [Chloroflexota bacterium]
MTTPSEVADELLAEAAALDREIEEIDMLVAQARTEAARHETRRTAATDKLAKLDATGTAREAVELANQVVTLTRRAALMDAQLEILEGKKRSSARLKESFSAGAEKVLAIEAGGQASTTSGSGSRSASGIGSRSASGGGSRSGSEPGSGFAATDVDDDAMAPAVSRLVLAAQEDLRREIARSMHDGPAQSLTNIVLQAEIVERLVRQDPKLAEGEVRSLVAMVQSTLEATKAFIFDVRPMVLDDLGLVPTLRRAARDRGQRAGLTVAFESIGVDRRLATEIESATFRIADDALAAYLAEKPDQASLTIDWGDALVLTLRASRTPKMVPPLDIPDESETLPPALLEMVAERRKQYEAAVEVARASAQVKLPARLLRELRQRGETLGIGLEIIEDGGGVRLSTAMSPGPEVPAPD